MWNTSIELDNRVKWERHSNCWWNREWMITPDSQTAANGWRRGCNGRLCNWLSMMQYHGCVECRSQTAFITSQLHTHTQPFTQRDSAAKYTYKQTSIVPSAAKPHAPACFVPLLVAVHSMPDQWLPSCALYSIVTRALKCTAYEPGHETDEQTNCSTVWCLSVGDGIVN